MSLVEQLTEEEVDAVLYDCRDGDLDTLKAIFEEVSPKVLPNLKDPLSGSTFVHMAAGNGHVECLRFLLELLPLEEAKQIVAVKNESGNTALNWAAINNHLEAVKLLCDKYSLSPFVKNNAGHDAIYEAEINGSEQVEDYFLATFALEDQVNIKDEGEDTKITYTPGNESVATEKEIAEMELEHKTNDLSLDRE